MGAGQAYFDEDLKGQVKHRTHERKDSWEVWAASRADALRICGAKIRGQLDILFAGRSGCRSAVHAAGSTVLVKASETGWSSMRVSSFRPEGACWLQFQRATLGVNSILCCKL